MRAIALSLVLAAALAGAKEPKAPERPSDALAALAGALSDADPSAFMRRIDPKAPHYEELSQSVGALLARGAVSSSIEPVQDKGDDSRRSMRLNWILRVEGIDRRAEVECELERRGGRWVVTRLEPVSFFAP